MAKIYEIAQSRREAVELRDDGYGYESREAAEAARRRVPDSYYRSLLHVYELEERHG